MGFLIAGHDTSSTTLLWLFKWLSDKQTVQDKLRIALRESFSRAYEAGELPTTQEISSTRVPYLDAVIEEVHRMTGAVGIQMRVATVDTDVLGHRIPKGTDVFMLTHSPDFVLPSIPIDESLRSNTSKESKGKNGSWDQATISDFDPERWLETDDEGKVVFNSRAGPTMPFGAGPRGCFGKDIDPNLLTPTGYHNADLRSNRSQVGRIGASHYRQSHCHELQARRFFARIEWLQGTRCHYSSAMASLCEAY
jgi:hypothetical protein